MSKFERIVREPLVMGGQARIRDTGITVNEIVRLSLDGSSQAEILQKFPQLEAEDVHQALGWNTYSRNEKFREVYSEISLALTPIEGYIGLILRFIPDFYIDSLSAKDMLEIVEGRAKVVRKFLLDLILS